MRRIKNDKQLPLLRKLLTQKLTEKQQQKQQGQKASDKKHYKGKGEQTSTPAWTELLVKAFPPPTMSEQSTMQRMMMARRAQNNSKFAGEGGVYSWNDMTLNDITTTSDDHGLRSRERQRQLIGPNHSSVQPQHMKRFTLPGARNDASVAARNGVSSSSSSSIPANRQSMQMIDLVNNLTLALQPGPSTQKKKKKKEEEVEKFSRLLSGAEKRPKSGEWSPATIDQPSVDLWRVNVSTPSQNNSGELPRVKTAGNQNKPRHRHHNHQHHYSQNAYFVHQKEPTFYKVLPKSKVDSDSGQQSTSWQPANNNNWRDTAEEPATVNIDHAIGGDGGSKWRWPTERSKFSKWSAGSGQLTEETAETRPQVQHSTQQPKADHSAPASEMEVNPHQSKTELLDAITRFVALQKVTSSQSETNDTDTGDQERKEEGEEGEGEADLQVPLTTALPDRPAAAAEVIDNRDKSFPVHWRPQLAPNHQLDGATGKETRSQTPTLVPPINSISISSSSNNNYNSKNDVLLEEEEGGKEGEEDSQRLLLSQLQPPLDWSDSKSRPRLLAAVSEKEPQQQNHHQHQHQQQQQPPRTGQFRKRVGRVGDHDNGRSTSAANYARVGRFSAVDGRGL